MCELCKNPLKLGLICLSCHKELLVKEREQGKKDIIKKLHSCKDSNFIPNFMRCIGCKVEKELMKDENKGD